ncbi:hypothetical protein [Paenibacillus bovis]|uniref:hypothetical protein n=1 Tax=Paenibacillus bovis TaxID=1616788 RepID=UPI000AA35445|nr:hypothetical protein [Paenibacillus bovis]
MNDKLTDNQIDSGLSLYYNLPKEPDAEQAVPVLFAFLYSILSRLNRETFPSSFPK